MIAAAIVLAACDGSPAGVESAECGGTLSLDVGEAADLPEAVDCDLGRHAGAEYALAYVDVRALALAETGGEPARGQRYSVTVTDLRGGGARQNAAPTPTAPRVAPDWSIAPAGEPRRYTRASGGDDGWTAGESITITDPCPSGQGCTDPPTRSARVLRVYPAASVAVAVAEGEVAGAKLDAMLAQIDGAMPLVASHALPLLKAVYTEGAPAVSAPGGQMLVLLEGDISSFAGRALSRLDANGSPESWISLEPFTDDRVAWAAALIAHELAHAYQFAYMARTRPAGAQVGTGTSLGGVEGGANLISYEFIRRAAGMPLAGNYDFRAPGSGFLEQYYAYRAQPGDGQLTAGYDSGMGFYRDLVIRRVRRGESEDAAVREVSLGAIEGWFGVDPGGTRRPGLTARMQQRMGGWEAHDALLTWALSHAGDDLTDSDVYRDRASLRVWDSAEADYGWFPEAVLEGGAGSITGETVYGSPGYFLLRDTGAGVAIRLGAGVPGVRWRVLRIR